MADLIRSELHHFLSQYMNAQRVVEPDQQDDGVGSRVRALEVKFANDTDLNPDGLTLREYFSSNTEEELRKKIAEARERLKLHSHIPLGQWVSYAESVITHGDAISRENYNQLFGSGLAQADLRRNLRFEHQYEDRDLHFLINNQSSEANRSIVELVSNAIDFSPAQGTVEVQMHADGYSVADTGAGMSMQDLVEKLSIPFISGSRGESKATIGKFGMGFLTVLRHLQQEGDRVRVDTAKDGEGQYIEFLYKQGGIVVSVGKQDEHSQGTRITVQTQDFDRHDAETLLSSHMRYKRGATVKVNGEAVTQPDELSFIDAETDPLKKVGVGYKQAEITNKLCNVVVAVNGIKIAASLVEGYNLPSTFVLDLPYLANIAESRDVVIYDEIFIESAKKVVDHLFAIDLSAQSRIQIVNALAEVLHAVEKQAVGNEQSTLQYLENALQTFVTQQKLTAIPAGKNWEYLDVPDAVLVSGKLSKVFESFFTSQRPIRNYRSYATRGYTARLRPDAPLPFLQHGNTVLLDETLHDELADHHEFLQAYLGFILKEEGTVLLSPPERGNAEEFNVSARFKTESYEERCLQAIQGSMQGDSLRPGFIDSRLFSYGDLVGSGKNTPSNSWEWLHHFTLGEEFYAELRAYVHGERDSITLTPQHFDMIIAKQRAEYAGEVPEAFAETVYKGIREMAKHTDKMLEGFALLRGLTDFFSAQNLTRYLALPPDQVEQALGADFLQRYGSIFSVEIAKEKQNQLRYMKYAQRDEDGPAPSEDRIVYGFDFISTVMKHAFEEDRILDNSELPMERRVVGGVLGRMSDVFLAFTARKNYLQAKSSLTDTQVQTFEQMLNFTWNREMTNPDGVFEHTYGSFWSRNIGMHEELMQGLARIAERVPAPVMRELIDTFVTDPLVTPESVMNLVAFLTDPYVGYHLIEYGGWLSDHFEKRENIIPALGNKKTGMELMKSFFREEDNFAYRYRHEGLEKFDEYEVFARQKHVEVAQGLLPFINKYKAIYGLPIVQQIFAQRFKEIGKEFGRVRSREDEHEFHSFEVADILYLSDGSFAPLSAEKLRIIEETIKGHFNPDFMDRKQCGAFAIYLRRVLTMTNFSDDEFAYLQPWFLQMEAFYTRDIYRREFFHPEMIQRLLEKRQLLQGIGLDLVAKIWNEVNDRAGDRFEEKLSQSERSQYVSRLIEIVADIKSKPKYLQDSIVRSLEGNGSYYKYTAFDGKKLDLATLPSLIHPYVLYFRMGDRTALSPETEYGVQGEQQHTFNISDLMHTYRASSGRFNEAVNNPAELEAVVKEQTTDVDKFVYFRELIHAVEHLPANDTYLFMRELLQNAYDASVTIGEGEKPVIHVQNFKEGNAYIIRMSDSVGMDFKTVFSKLLIPGVSSKREGVELGRFGIGFMSIFKDARRVEIITGDGKERTTVVAEAVRNEKGQLIDIRLNYSVEPSTRKGTMIRKYANVENPSLESSKVQASMIRYGAYLDSEKVDVVYDGDVVNKPRAVLSANTIPEFGTVEIIDGVDLALLEGRLFVNALPKYIEDLIPAGIRSIVLDSGLALNLPPTVGLTRSRQDISDKEAVLPYLRTALPAMIIESTVKKFTQGKIALTIIPYDYFLNDFSFEYWKSRVDPAVLQDAETIKAGEGLADWSRYSSRHQLLELMTLLPAVEIDGVKRSLQEINEMRRAGYEFKLDKLPKYIADEIIRSRRIEQEEKESTEKSRDNKEMLFMSSVVDERTRPILEAQSDTHLAFLDIVASLYPQDETVTYGYSNMVGHVLAHAAIQQKEIMWNLRYADWKIHSLARVLREKRMNTQAMYAFIAQVVQTSTHETAHLQVGTQHWGDHHTDHFWKQQTETWSTLMRSHAQIVADALHRVEGYVGSLMGDREVERLLAGASS